jgi:hypothetical protein
LMGRTLIQLTVTPLKNPRHPSLAIIMRAVVVMLVYRSFLPLPVTKPSVWMRRRIVSMGYVAVQISHKIRPE